MCISGYTKETKTFKIDTNIKMKLLLDVYYTGPKSSIITFFLFVGSTTLGTILNFYSFVH